MNTAMGAATASTLYHVQCIGADGREKWRETVKNLVVNAGLNYILTAAFKDGAIANWFVGLKSTGSAAAGDTLASHGGWTEITAYSGSRKALTLGTVSGQSVDNVANRAEFDITGSATVGGAFVGSVASGTSGTLYGAANFSAPREVENGDTLIVSVTLTTAAA